MQVSSQWDVPHWALCHSRVGTNSPTTHPLQSLTCRLMGRTRGPGSPVIKVKVGFPTQHGHQVSGFLVHILQMRKLRHHR